MPLRRLLILSACLGVLPAAAAMACPDHGEKAAVATKSRLASAASVVAWKPRAWTPPSAVGVAGLRVEIDPVDGAFSMPAPDLAASSAASDEDLRPVSLVRRANGAVRAQLDERWASHAVAAIGPDGKLRWTCVDGRKNSEKFMQNPVITAPAPSTTKWEEK